MTITSIENLSTREGLKLHESFAGFAGGQSLLLMTEGRAPKVTFLGDTHKNVHALADRLNATMNDIAPGSITGFAGKHTLSCHFKDGALDKLKEAVTPVAVHDFTVQISGRSDYFQKAVTRWCNLHNREFAAQTPPHPQIQLEGVIGGNGAFNLVLPDLKTLQEFEFRLHRGFFDVEARNIEHSAAGVKLEQHTA